MARVIHFELAADDPERATEFYTKVFGWQIQKWDGPQDYWLATTGAPGAPGIDGAIMRRDPGMSARGAVWTAIVAVAAPPQDRHLPYALNLPA